MLDQTCPECGFDTRSFPREEVAGRLRANAAAWRQALAATPDPARRPDPATWSALEYACHVRDCCRVFAERLRLMLTEDDPLYPNWDQDATAAEDDYAGQDPAAVAADLSAAAAVLADGFAAVSGDQWDRPGRRSDGAHFTVESFARYFLHDPVHHLYDVTRPRPS